MRYSRPIWPRAAWPAPAPAHIGIFPQSQRGLFDRTGYRAAFRNNLPAAAASWTSSNKTARTGTGGGDPAGRQGRHRRRDPARRRCAIPEAALKAVDEAGIPAVPILSGRPAREIFRRQHQRFRSLTRHDAVSGLSLGAQAHRLHERTSGPDRPSGQCWCGFIEAMTEAGLSVGTEQVAPRLLTAIDRDSRPPRNCWTATIQRRSSPAMTIWPPPPWRWRIAEDLDVPQDISVVGFDDTPAGHHRLARTHHHPPADLGYGARGGAAADRPDPWRPRRRRRRSGSISCRNLPWCERESSGPGLAKTRPAPQGPGQVLTGPAGCYW